MHLNARIVCSILILIIVTNNICHMSENSFFDSHLSSCPGKTRAFVSCEETSLVRLRLQVSYPQSLDLETCTITTRLTTIPINHYPAGTYSDKPLSPYMLIKSGQPAHECTLIRLYTVGRSTSSSNLDILKNDNDQFQKLKMEYSM